MTTTQSIITILVVVLGTMLTRFLPFLVFPGGENTAALYYLFRHGAALCRHWPVGGILPERCSFRVLSWPAGIDCHCLYFHTP